MGRGQLRHIAPRKAGEHQHPGPAGQRRQLGQHLQSIHTGKHEIHHHDVRGELLCQADRLLPVPCLCGQLQAGFLLQRTRKDTAELLTGIGHQDPLSGFQY